MTYSDAIFRIFPIASSHVEKFLESVGNVSLRQPTKASRCPARVAHTFVFLTKTGWPVANERTDDARL